jgi:hypothetical protein
MRLVLALSVKDSTHGESVEMSVYPLCGSPENYFVYRLFAAAAFLISAAPFVASASDSKPNMPEYFLPTTWATTKSMLMPASAMA